MVTTTFRQVLETSGSTITNSGRISLPDSIHTTPPSAEETEDEGEEEGDLPQPLPATTITFSNAATTAAAPAPLTTVIRSVPPRATSNGTAVSSLTIDSASSSYGYGGNPPPPPPPRIFTEARDGSAGSRDSLRLQVLRRKMSLTSQEHKYLGDLLVHGNEIEVQLAYEKLQDDELFFDHQTPKHYMGQPLVFWEHGSIPGIHSEGEQPSSNAAAGESAGVLPPLERSTSQGSLRRMQALEQRKNSIQHLTLWRAHESGLAVTNNGSRNSLLRRSSNSSGVPKPPPSADIFRQHQRRPSSSSKGHSKMPMMPPRPVAGLHHPRSQSLFVPDIPPRSRFERRSSTNSSRKSVTFHQQTDGTPKPKAKKTLRRSISDTNVLTSPLLLTDAVPKEAEGHPPLAARQESTSSIPSIHHAHPIRQDSVSSIPSLHHGHLIREDSVSSIPSLHHGHPIRQDSVSSIPSLHHGHLVREESTTSIPSLHHGHPIRQESVSSVASLHHGQPLQEESFAYGQFIRSDSAKSIPSLHHGHALMDDTSTTAASAVENVLQYAASHDIANVWLQQQQPPTTREEQEPSLPHAVTIPANTTDETHPSTVGTATTTASTAHWEDDDDDEVEEQPQGSTHSSSADGSASKPVLMRLASRNAYEGEGIEVMEMHDQPLQENYYYGGSRTFPGMISMDASIRTCNSWDTALSSYQPHPEIFRGAIHRSLSDDDMGPIFWGSGGTLNTTLQPMALYSI
jgi:hypothetical protein